VPGEPLNRGSGLEHRHRRRQHQALDVLLPPCRERQRKEPAHRVPEQERSPLPVRLGIGNPDQLAEVGHRVVDAIDHRTSSLGLPVPAVVERVERVPARCELFARPRIAAAVLGHTVRHRHDSPRLPVR
jgi:hypothetical protein